ncbi:hypothetical protein HYDPIDRAFT_91048, partial [Hydnomerulius pinastri MD-312]
GAFSFYAPKLYRFYEKNMNLLFKSNACLHKNFWRGVFPAASFNCSGQAFTICYTNSLNLSYGLCAVWAGGSYDPKQGGHLILFELGLVVEFSPGATIFIPSSIVSHGNIPIQEGETWVSFTQYCAGGLIQWIQHALRRPARTLAPQI